MNDKHAAGEMIKHINDSLEKQANNSMRSTGLTISQLGMLLKLNENKEGKLQMKDLEKSLHVAQSTASGIASRLESKGMIESFGDPDNKKIKIVGITDKGKELCINADFHMKEAEKYLLHGLSTKEKEEFIRLLTKVSESL